MGSEALLTNTTETNLQPGQVVGGKYRVDYLLGEGGMAAVWAGTNERTGKRVALKVILRSLLLNTPGSEFFLSSEALAASRVNHPNVVTVFDLVGHEAGACIVMELLDGEPLGNYIARNGALSVAEAAGLLLPAMRGVAAAHAQGVVHRDLKPQNIFICIGPDGRIVTTKVLDFGISVMLDRAMERLPGAFTGMVGTPAYMSPEHIEGAANIDERADVYGFGVILYEALTGCQAFPGEPGTELFYRVLRDPAPPITGFRPDLSAGMVRIIETAMAKVPNRRYANLNLMVHALEDESMPATLPPRPPTPTQGVQLSASSPPSLRSISSAKRPLPATALFVSVPTPTPTPTPARRTSPSPDLEQRSAAPLPRPIPLSAFRQLRGLAVAGVALAIPFVAWIALSSTGRGEAVARTRANSTTNVLVARRTMPVVVPIPNIPFEPAPDPLRAELEPTDLAAHGLRAPTGRARAAHAPTPASRSRVAKREILRPHLTLGKPALEVPPADVPIPPAISVGPRAGGLSVNDF